jgi:hypothetical protein
MIKAGLIYQRRQADAAQLGEFAERAHTLGV